MELRMSRPFIPSAVLSVLALAGQVRPRFMAEWPQLADPSLLLRLGPVIEARVGDVVEVRLTNRLPEPTTIHWHGLRVPAAMDGTDMVQRPVLPGQTFTYRFRVPDAGTFWYHPHNNETVQLEKGLYG